MWLIVPLGNPGVAYDGTRHNFGRLMMMRWMMANGCRHPKVLLRLRFGDIYSVSSSLHLLIPNTYMNLSGAPCVEAVSAGYDLQHIIVIHDDKDLPLGLGRMKLTGSDGGHNGLKSIIERLRCRDISRLRLGMGPFQRPLVNFVMGKWTRVELDNIATMSIAFFNFIALLQNTTNLSTLVNVVNNVKFWIPKDS